MTDIDVVKERLDSFVEAMVTKMSTPDNARKEDWRDATSVWRVLFMVQDEVMELEDAIGYFEHFNLEDVLDECVDVANTVFMLWDKARSDDETENKAGA